MFRHAIPTATEIGTRFELASLEYLTTAPFRMELARIGGAGDGGVDLKGWWTIGVEPTRRVRVIVQCKAETKSIGPNVLRELEGTLQANVNTRSYSVREREGKEGTATMAMLISQSGFTSATTARAAISPWPTSLVHLVPIDTRFEENCEVKGSSTEYECLSISINAPLRLLLRDQLKITTRQYWDEACQKTIKRPVVEWNP